MTHGTTNLTFQNCIYNFRFDIIDVIVEFIMSNRGFISQEKTDNAIKLSESDVVNLRRDRVFQWPNLSEMYNLILMI